MNYKATTYASYDGMKLSGYIWEPEEKPKAIINLVHGWGEYSERFDFLASQFTAKGYLAHAIDYRGHGKSDGRRGHIKFYDEFLNDIDVLLGESHKLYPDLPQFIYGHSLGGNITTNYILKRENQLRGAIISSPWYKLSFNPNPLLLLIARIIKKIYPKFTQKGRIDINALTHDQDFIEKYVDDPLIHGKISVKMFYEISQAGKWVLENADKVNIPVLIQHGNDDRITLYKASKEFAEKAKALGKDIVYKEWDGMYHELHNEIEKEAVFSYAFQWIEKILTN